tara:strand:+ start:1213 stop:1350 length:138 start_codon:yes stop_codon:yes gene_type:complete
MDVRIIVSDIEEKLLELKQMIIKYETENKTLKIKINDMKKYIKNK